MILRKKGAYDRKLASYYNAQSLSAQSNTQSSSSSSNRSNSQTLYQEFKNFVQIMGEKCYSSSSLKRRTGLNVEVRRKFEDLISRGLNINTTIEYERRTINMLHMAITNNDPDFIKFLVERGIDIDVPVIRFGENISSFRLATRDFLDDNKILSALISKETDIQTIDSFLEGGVPPLFYVAKRERIQFMEAIIQEGQKRGILDTLLIHDRVHLLHALSKVNYIDGVKLLINSGVDVNLTDNFGDTALHVAIKSGSHAVARELINYGASLTAENNKGEAALFLAVRGKDKESVNMIINYLAKEGNIAILDNIIEDYIGNLTRRNTHLKIASRLTDNPEVLLNLSKFQKLTEISDLMENPDILIQSIERLNQKEQQRIEQQSHSIQAISNQNELGAIDIESFEQFGRSEKGKRKLERHAAQIPVVQIPSSPSNPNSPKKLRIEGQDI